MVLAKAIAVIIAIYLIYGAYLYFTGSVTDIMGIVIGPADAIWGIIHGLLAGAGINI